MPKIQENTVNLEAAQPSGERGVSRVLSVGDAAEGVPPSNRTPSNPTRILRCGIDSLFVSFQGELHPPILEELSRLKELAQSDISSEQAKAQITIGEHVFIVTDKGAKGFSFCLQDNAFFIKLSKNSSSTMPFASAQISSEYLTHAGETEAFQDLLSVISYLGTMRGSEKVSRADLFVDFVSSVDFSALNSENLICNAKKITWREEKPLFTGFDIGLGGKTAFRLYDKTFELKLRPRPYLFPLWKASGWLQSEKVWRAEFEIKRQSLRSFGFDTVNFIHDYQHVLWDNLSQRWLRLVEVNPTDTHRERWKVLPVWSTIQAAFGGGSNTYPLEKFNFCRIPSDDYLYKHGLSGITSFMAREGIDDYEKATKLFLAKADHYHKTISHNQSDLGDYLKDKTTNKKRRYNKTISDGDSHA